MIKALKRLLYLLLNFGFHFSGPEKDDQGRPGKLFIFMILASCQALSFTVVLVYMIDTQASIIF